MERWGIAFGAILALLLQTSIASAGETSEEDILNWKAPADFKKKYTYYLSGYDKEGSPIYVVEFGKWDIRGAFEQSPDTVDQLDKLFTQMFVRGTSHGNIESGSPGTLVIFDGEGLSLRQVSHPEVIPFLVRQAEKLEKILREPGIKRIIGVNYNFVMERLHQLISPLLGASASIIQVYGTNAERWKPVLLRQIDADQLPAWYGGSKDHKPLKVFPQ